MAATRNNNRKDDMFQKKVPQNPKYKHVKSTLDTGASITNYMGKIEEMRKNYRFRKDEIFKRIKVSTFAQLFLQVAEVVNMELESQELETAKSQDFHLDENENNDELTNRSNNGSTTDRSLLQDVICGLGEIKMNEQNIESLNLEENDEKQILRAPDPTSLPFLLLDVRDKDDFNECHIIGAINYPAPMLTRSVNYLIKEMLEFKNKAGKIIIVYDDDEKLAPNVATVLVQRDIDNVIMLSGGMKVLNKKFSGCFLAGTLPSTCFSPLPERKGKARKAPVVVENEGLTWYNSDLLEKIQDHLDNVLLENESRMSSRVSSRSTTKANQTNQSGRNTGSSTASSLSKRVFR